MFCYKRAHCCCESLMKSCRHKLVCRITILGISVPISSPGQVGGDALVTTALLQPQQQPVPGSQKGLSSSHAKAGGKDWKCTSGTANCPFTGALKCLVNWLIPPVSAPEFWHSSTSWTLQIENRVIHSSYALIKKRTQTAFPHCNWDLVSILVTIGRKIPISLVMNSICQHLFLCAAGLFVSYSNHPNANALCSLA